MSAQTPLGTIRAGLFSCLIRQKPYWLAELKGRMLLIRRAISNSFGANDVRGAAACHRVARSRSRPAEAETAMDGGAQNDGNSSRARRLGADRRSMRALQHLRR